jgi:hypothetical protein
MLPIYPLDGGQILRSLLWFVFGRAKSLLIATVVGFLGVLSLVALAVFLQSYWLGLICVFILLNCWSGLQNALQLLKYERLPRHTELACPTCQESPPAGDIWVCGRCGARFDIFAARSTCPNCAALFQEIRCRNCGRDHTLPQWAALHPASN